MKKSNNTISDWLDKFGDPEIDKKVEIELEKINKERYDQIIGDAYKTYEKAYEKDNSVGLSLLVARTDGKTSYRKPTKEQFIDMIEADDEFAEKWGVKITERELTLEERYNKWFNNNYETGMERYFDPNNLPDFDNDYYEPTPTKEITLEYKEEKVSYYE
jgi:hypothetical protein